MERIEELVPRITTGRSNRTITTTQEYLDFIYFHQVVSGNKTYEVGSQMTGELHNKRRL
jgi:hypothetical protein